MAYAVLTANTDLSMTMADLFSNPAGTYSFTVDPGSAEEFYVIDDDAVFDDPYTPSGGYDDPDQIVAAASTIFADDTEVAPRHLWTVTPDNGDPPFKVYVIYEDSTTNDDYSPLDTLDYALLSVTPLVPGVNYAITFESGDGTVNYSDFTNLLLCFAAGTQIETGQGPTAVETLQPGDLVLTADHGPQPVLWVGKTEHRWSQHPNRHKPILFSAGSLGAGVPVRDLTVSPQHRMLVPTPSHDQGALCPAKGLTGLKGVRQMQGCRAVELVHLMFDAHHVVFAEGAPSESFYPGPCALQALSEAQRNAIQRLVPNPDDDNGATAFGSAPARPFLTRLQAQARFSGEAECWTADRLAACTAGSALKPKILAACAG